MMHEYSIQPYRIFTDMAYLGFYHHTCKCLTDKGALGKYKDIQASVKLE